MKNSKEARRLPTPEAVEELKKIYEKNFGVELTDGEAQEEAIRILRLFKLLCRPTPTGEEKGAKDD